MQRNYIRKWLIELPIWAIIWAVYLVLDSSGYGGIGSLILGAYIGYLIFWKN